MRINRPFTPYRENRNPEQSTDLPRLTPFFNDHSTAASYIEGFFEPVAFHHRLSKSPTAAFPAAYQPSHAYPEDLYTLVRALPLMRRSVTKTWHANPQLLTVKELSPLFANKIKYLTGDTKANYEENLGRLCVATVKDYKELAHFLYFTSYSEAYPVPIGEWMKPAPDQPDVYPAHHTITAVEALAEWYRIPGVTQAVEFIEVSLHAPKCSGALAKAYTKPFSVGLDPNDSKQLLEFKVNRDRRRQGELAKRLTSNFNLPMYVHDSRTPYSLIHPYEYREAAARLDPYYRGPVRDGESPSALLDTLIDLFGEVPLTMMSLSRKVSNCYALPVRYWSLVLDYYPTRFLLHEFFTKPSAEVFSKIYYGNQIIASGESITRVESYYEVSKNDAKLEALLAEPWGTLHLDWLYANLIRFI